MAFCHSCSYPTADVIFARTSGLRDGLIWRIEQNIPKIE